MPSRVAIPNVSYETNRLRIMPSTPAANAERIAELVVDTSWREILTKAETESTNQDLLIAAADGAEPGLVIIANFQSSGRGRFNRNFEAPPGTSVSISALVRPTRPHEEWGWLSLLTGIAVASAIRDISDGSDRVSLKWPNDVLVDQRKICGILCESDGTNVTIGMGINTSMDTGELPVPHAISLLLAGFPTEKDELIARVLIRLDEIFTRWDETGDIRDEYLAASDTIGREVRVVLSEDESMTGIAVSVAKDGELVVETPSGPQTFSAGDVIHLRPTDSK